MNLKISGQHLEVTEAMRLSMSITVDTPKPHTEQITALQISFRPDKDQGKATSNIDVSAANIQASITEKNMYTAIGLMIDRLDQQARTHMENPLSRQQGHR
jgi:putative sigma-54 modulation protein